MYFEIKFIIYSLEGYKCDWLEQYLNNAFKYISTM